MKLLTPRQTSIVAHPWDFAVCTLKAFKANQGLLLAGAVAYYALLSVVPLLILMSKNEITAPLNEYAATLNE